MGMPKIKWLRKHLSRLGREPDGRLAQSMGVSPGPVRSKRIALGIPKYRKERRTRRLIAMLGRMPDTAIAKAMGVDPKTVGIKRHECGIAETPSGCRFCRREPDAKH